MSANNKAILERANAAVAKGDHEGFLSHCTDDVEWVFVGDTALKGKDAVRRYMRATYIEPPTFVVDQLIAEGEFVTAIWAPSTSRTRPAGSLIPPTATSGASATASWPS